MTTVTTKITSLLNIRAPIICAPMAGASGGALAAAVSLAGGFGFIGTGYITSDSLVKELNIAKFALSSANSALEHSRSSLPIGVGFLVWRLEEMGDAGVKLVELTLSNCVVAVWFSFGNNIRRWVEYVHDYDRERSHKTLIFILVNSVDEAKEVWAHNLADVIVAQGIEAGGHGSSFAPPLLTLVPEILEAVPENIPVLAAGGLSNGTHVAALLTLGAAGVVFGTRFLLTEESLYTPSQKEALVQAKDTLRTTAFDEARGTTGWPKGIDGRGLHNQLMRNVKGAMPPLEVKKNFEEAIIRDDANGMVVWAGTGVRLMKEVKKAAHVVQETQIELLNSLKTSREIVVSGST